jgi:uncharacterized protein
VTEPTPLDPAWPRYSLRPFPSYRYVPGQTQHPRRHPLGHSYGNPEPSPQPFHPNEWQTSDDYRYGIDLYNFAYWWESHEIFEAFWHAAERGSEQGNFLQGLIQLAAANLKRAMNNEAAAQKLSRAGITRLQRVAVPYMGIDVHLVLQALSEYLSGTHPHLPLLRLRDGTNSFGGERQP